MLRQKNSNWSEAAPTASQTEERGKKGQRFNLGEEGKATAETRGRSVAGNGAGGGEPRAAVAGDSGRPAPGVGLGRIGPGGAPRHGARPREEAERPGGRGGGRFGGGVLGKGSEGGGERPGGAGGQGGQPGNPRRASREGASAGDTPRIGGEGWRGGGAGRVGEGRSRASHNNKSQPLPTPTSKPPVPRVPDCTHSGTGSVRAPSGCGVGGWRVCRSLSPGGPAPARPSSGLSTRCSTPTSGSPATQANGFRKSLPILPGLGLARLSPLSFCGSSLPAPGCPETPRKVPRFVLYPALVLHVVCVTWASIFPTAASLSPAFMSP